MGRRGLRAGAGAATLLAVVAAVGVGGHRSHGVASRTAHAAGRTTPTAAPRASHVQIVAHPDDDLYFMNPDVEQAIKAGDPVATIYVEAAEANGRNARRGQGRTAPVDYTSYSAARHEGVRRAYARMATGSPQARWIASTISTAAGPVEMDHLQDAPQVRLVFLDVGTWRRPGGMQRLSGLWDGSVRALDTRPARGSLAPARLSYTRNELIAQLAGLLARLRPTVVRAQDPDPERGYDRKGKGHRIDHPDHTATAQLAWRAIWRYESSAHLPVVTEFYRGYDNRHWPHNLDASAERDKMALIGTYGDADLQVGRTGDLNGWPQSTRARYPGTTGWIAPLADGRMAAVAVVSGRVTFWEETAPNGAWRAGRPISSPGFISDLSLLALPGGRLAVFGVRVSAGSSITAPRYRILYATRPRPGGDFGRWQDLGNPAGHATARQRDVGAPVPAIDGRGRITIFSRNGGLGVSGRTQRADGSFGPWQDLGGHRIEDGLATGTDATGRIELFGAATPVGWRWDRPSGTPGLWHWRQREPGAPMGRGTYTATPGPVTGPLTMSTDTKGGGLTLLARVPETASTLAFRASRPGGSWTAVPTDLAGPGGHGPIGSAGASVLAGRDDLGTVAISDTGAWTHSGPLFVHAPGIALDAQGQPVIAALGVDGRLNIARRSASSAWRWQEVS
ncbi:PIG-L family deacetylase [Actinomadura barringtoniae]|uniref:PIG-L family deacetylase n=1 Tax=Actinomadura barringtoniae TaxID=1427535 RepID=A0A939PAC2_9ACTN|nr:PIG-L family deacetylase [Actinomadura barringtoniae]MBO2448472.1 PIG-L family deacetylase [Actinomadura barringtoniae]